MLEGLEFVVQVLLALRRQEAELSERDRAMLRVTEHFAKSLKVTQDHWKWLQSTALSAWYHFQRYSEILVKVAIFHTSPALYAPVRGSPSKYWHNCHFQIYFVSLTSLVSIHLLIHLSTHLSHHPTVLHSFTPGSKHTFQ